MRDVSASYGSRRVLVDVTARVPRSQVTAVVGANGAGKSSLLNVIAGTLPPTSGTLRRTGSRRPAYVVQRSDVSDALPITVRGTVEMGRWAHRGPWRRLTARDHAVVADCLARLDIRDLAERQLGALSGGQRQRALVAQGLAQEAELLLLDEPGAGLDLAAQTRIEDALAQACRDGVTVLRVTHDLDVARRADHCLLLRDGRLVAEGLPEAVLTPERVRAAWGVPDLA
ncbi:ATPase component of Mn/Zn ABC-type transporter [Actinoalloteichus sp. GBA129-24]|uniref:ATPase component of Mn/Zn ABC-type transporter n=2 Tax=Pseudonocardiaceae TaxID=2070 RepID=A0AAC9LE28_9PSEU|nr:MULTISPECIES: zinc ABC transporter ATP-binding protein AztA [Actinoalloteichus]APU15946.1 ATPase component of Mn/Zn ABC-type transporter [Actinoalloteichus fjordicus]APU22009.1 ATPase component of Mn/Zn ABC-type transporter [Actinoalloteichus sp. GBA129-24]